MDLKSSLKVSIVFFITVLFFSCSDNSSSSSSPEPISRQIKYEITGTYTGHLDVVYSDVNGNNMSEVVTSLPWSKTITYPASMTFIGIGASSVIANAGVAGQTGSLKIYSGNTVKRTSDKVVGQNGLLLFDTQTYNFQ